MDTHTDSFTEARQRCWTHIETATKMIECLDLLKGIKVASAVPIISDVQPSLMITPEQPDNLLMIKILCRKIQDAMKVETEWQHLSINDAWLLRLKLPSRLTIDLMTRLTSVKESPISL